MTHNSFSKSGNLFYSEQGIVVLGGFRKVGLEEVLCLEFRKEEQNIHQRLMLQEKTM